MRNCSVLNCSNNSGKPSSVSNRVSFHLFPKDPETRQAWIYATGRINWTPRQHSTICSEHFTEYDFTTKNGKKFLRSTSVPRFNLTEQNTRYSESQYHNETQAALEFLTGQMFPENQIPVEQESEVVTVQVIGGNNPHVVVRKPVAEPQTKPSTPEKKPRYFSLVNVFKSEAELKAEKDKIHELVRDNLDPSISKVLLSLEERPVKKKKKKNNENSTHQGNTNLNLPRAKNGQWLKAKKSSTTSATEGHYTDGLTREEIVDKLKQRDIKIHQQQLTIRELQKKHLRDQVEIESLRVKLKINNQTEEPTSEPIVQTPQYTHLDSTLKKPAQQQIVTQKRQRMETTNIENHYQTDTNFLDQGQAYFDTQNRHSDDGLKKPARKKIVTQKRQKLETTNTENHYQSNRNFSDQDQAYVNTQNRHSDVGLKKPAQQQIVIQKRQRIETTNTENNYQSSRNFSDQDQAYVNTQNRHSDVGLKKPAQQQIVIQKRQRLETTNTENHSQSNRNFLDQGQAYFETQNRHSDVGLKKPAQQQNVVIQNQEILVTLDRTHFWNF